MAKFQNDSIFDDGTHAYVRLRCTRITVCDAQPATYTAATTTSGDMLAQSAAITSTDFTLGDGDTSGRKIALSSQTNISISASGTASHVAWVSTSGSALLLITTCTTQVLTSGGTVSVPTHDFELRDVA